LLRKVVSAHMKVNIIVEKAKYRFMNSLSFVMGVSVSYLLIGHLQLRNNTLIINWVEIKHFYK